MSSQDIDSSNAESDRSISSDIIEAITDRPQRELDLELLTENKYWDQWTIKTFPAYGGTTGSVMWETIKGFHNTNFKRRNQFNIELHDLEPMTRVMSRLVHKRVSLIEACKDRRKADLEANPAVSNVRDVWHPTIFVVSRRVAIGLGVRFQWGRAPILAEWAEGVHFAFFITNDFIATCRELLKPADIPDTPEGGSDDLHIIQESECSEVVDHMGVKHKGLDWWIWFSGYHDEPVSLRN